jgi:hypothetical protein
MAREGGSEWFQSIGFVPHNQKKITQRGCFLIQLSPIATGVLAVKRT